ncbi:MAG TPA: TolC family protein [Vulgatibacter sp.]|nr:TolC family protein [Vulgatibacter sp.]
MSPVRHLLLTLLLAPVPALAQEEPPSRVGNEEPGVSARREEGLPSLDIGTTPADVIPDAGARVITLEEMLQRAQAFGGNQDLVVLREQVVQAHDNVTRAWSALLPNVNAAFAYTRNSHAATIPFPNFQAGFQPSGQTTPEGGEILVPVETIDVSIQQLDQLSAVGTASMPLLLMPAYFGISSAKKGVTAAEQSTTFARNEIVLGIAQAYYGAVASRRLIEVSYSQVQVQKEQERVAKAQFEAGQAPKVNWLRASVSRIAAEQDLVRAQNSYVSTKLALQQLTGVQEPFDVAPPAPVEAPEGGVDTLVQVGLENRQDLAASRTAVEIARRTLQSNYWQFAPVISAQGQYVWANVSGFTGANTNWAVTLTASLNIFDGGLRYANLRDARSLKRQAEARNISLARTVKQDVETSLLSLESARANLVKAEEQARLAAENAELVRAQYDAGVATYLDVVDALGALFASQVSAVTNQLNVQVASLQLSRAIGKLGVSQFP